MGLVIAVSNGLLTGRKRLSPPCRRSAHRRRRGNPGCGVGVNVEYPELISGVRRLLESACRCGNNMELFLKKCIGGRRNFSASYIYTR